MTDLNHKRRQCRAKADQERRPWVIFTHPDDFEPKILCDVPLSLLPDGAEIVEHVLPRTAR